MGETLESKGLKSYRAARAWSLSLESQNRKNNKSNYGFESPVKNVRQQ